MSDLLQSEPPVSEQAEPVKYSISEDVKKLQKTMEELFIKQKEKGGIIDLEAEEKKFLVVTNSQESRDGADSNTFTELSPTDYQLGMLSFSDVYPFTNFPLESSHVICYR